MCVSAALVLFSVVRSVSVRRCFVSGAVVISPRRPSPRSTRWRMFFSE
jgi:hypothetical protein